MTAIKTAIKQQKTRKVAGPDNIPPEAIGIDLHTTTNMLHSFVGQIWEEEKMPTDRGDLRNCNHGITLLSVQSKIFNGVILDLKEAVDKRLQDLQASEKTTHAQVT